MSRDDRDTRTSLHNSGGIVIKECGAMARTMEGWRGREKLLEMGR